jgi:S1-C subfamily serine protease
MTDLPGEQPEPQPPTWQPLPGPAQWWTPADSPPPGHAHHGPPPPPGYGGPGSHYGPPPPPGYGEPGSHYGPPPPPGYGEPGSTWAYGGPTMPAPGYGGVPGGDWRPRRRRGLAVAVAVAALLAAAVGGGFVGHALTGSPAASAGGLPRRGSGNFPGGGFGGFSPGQQPGGSNGQGFGGSPAGGSSGSGPSDASAIAARVDPGLVDVNTTIDYGSAQGAGTGMVLTPSGEVLTNNHVIEGATAISVTDVGNHRTYSATVLGYSVSNDVAVLKLSGASGLRTVTPATAAASSGAEVVAIGNAGGTGGTPSYAGGSVTGTGKSVTAQDDLTGTAEHLTGMIRTNANVQAGDSGGPLVNSSGRVLGMDTAGSTTFQFAGQAPGEGFAIPITTATGVASRIVAGTSSATIHTGPTAFLGVKISGQGQGGFGSGNGSASGNGVTIAGTVPGSPASGTGLAAGDAITAVGSHRVSTQSSLQDVMVRDYRPGQAVTIYYTDTAGQQHSATVNLASGPPA